MAPRNRRILVIDVGGTTIKVSHSEQPDPVKIPSGPTMTARAMVTAVKKTTAQWKYDAVSIGYSGPVANGKPATEPPHLAAGWMKLDFAKAFGRPVRMINDAAMQALGNYEGGRMLYLGLGTGFGTAMIFERVIEPLELSHLPYRAGRNYGDYVASRGLLRLGEAKWRRQVLTVMELFRTALQPDYVVVGGGNARLLKTLPEHTRLGIDNGAHIGGVRMWDDDYIGIRLW